MEKTSLLLVKFLPISISTLFSQSIGLKKSFSLALGNSFLFICDLVDDLVLHNDSFSGLGVDGFGAVRVPFLLFLMLITNDDYALDRDVVVFTCGFLLIFSSSSFLDPFKYLRLLLMIVHVV